MVLIIRKLQYLILKILTCLKNACLSTLLANVNKHAIVL